MVITSFSCMSVSAILNLWRK